MIDIDIDTKFLFEINLAILRDGPTGGQNIGTTDRTVDPRPTCRA